MATKTATAPEAPVESGNAWRHATVKVAGRMTADAEMRTTPTEKSVCKLRVACGKTTYVDVIAWEELALGCAEYGKGTEIVAEGRLQTRVWEAADGTKRYATEVVATKVAKR